MTYDFLHPRISPNLQSWMSQGMCNFSHKMNVEKIKRVFMKFAVSILSVAHPCKLKAVQNVISPFYKNAKLQTTNVIFDFNQNDSQNLD